MIPSRPYLLRALHEWILDNGMTPHVLADAGADGVQVPTSAIQNGKVVLNVSPSAVRDLDLSNDFISFVARFSGVTSGVVIPMAAVLAIYARENGQGMMFPKDEETTESVPPEDKPEKGRRHLKVIK